MDFVVRFLFVFFCLIFRFFSEKKIIKKEEEEKEEIRFLFVYLQEKNENGSTSVFIYLLQMDK